MSGVNEWLNQSPAVEGERGAGKLGSEGGFRVKDF